MLSPGRGSVNRGSGTNANLQRCCLRNNLCTHNPCDESVSRLAEGDSPVCAGVGVSVLTSTYPPYGHLALWAAIPPAALCI